MEQRVSSSSSAAFQWGEQVAGSDTSYERMCYKGVWYNVLDCVVVRSDAVLPHVGKLMRLYEEGGRRKVRMRWFFRTSELPYAVTRDLCSKDNKELFLGQGSIHGVENENVVETIERKVIVLCTARCPRNPQPSKQQVDAADYTFNRVYDALQKKLVKMDRVERNLAQKFFNKKEWLSPLAVENATYLDLKSPTSVADFEMVARKRPSPNPQGSCATECKKFKEGP